jgi:hypothetical protein
MINDTSNTPVCSVLILSPRFDMMVTLDEIV